MSIEKKNESPYILEVRTVQSSAIKILTEGLKELLTECSIEFDDEGLKIVTMDNNHAVLVHLKLNAGNFELYYLNNQTKENKLTIGLNMIFLHKLIRTINSNDTLTLFIEANDINHLGIRIENGEKNTKTTYKIDLLDLDNANMHINPVDFKNTITLPSVDFQKICRDMKNIANTIEIKNINNQLILSCKGNFCSQETILIDNENGNNHINNTEQDEIIQGVYDLNYLVLFTKCTNLCNSVEIFMKNDYPLIVRYACASLGSLKLCLAPTAKSN